MKIVVFNLPAHGHINPSLSIVQELVERGHEVIYFGEEEFRTKIVATGAEYREYPQLPQASHVDHSILLNNYYFLIYRILGKTYLSGDYLLTETKALNPDYILFDSVCFWGKFVSEILNIKSISLNTVYLFDPKKTLLWSLPKDIITLNFSKITYLIKGSVVNNLLTKKYGIKKEGLIERFLSKGDLNFVFTVAQFQHNYEKYRALNFAYVGPSILDRGEEYDTIDYTKLQGKVIYIALGTITNDEIGFYKDCIHNLKNHPGTVVISVGKKIDRAVLGDIPDNFIIKNYVNQLQILQHAHLFISHGGMNSVQEGLYNAVPLVVSPRHIEQNRIGRQVQEIGCGLVVETYSSKQIFASLHAILENYEYYKNNCIALSQALRNAGGYKKVVDMIEEDFGTK